MGIMQIDHHGGDGRPERRSWLQPGRGFGRRPLAAAHATPAEQAHPGHIGAYQRQLDADVDLLRGLRRLGEHRSALGAGRQPPVDLPVGVRMQSPAHAGAALAGWTIRTGGGRALLLALGGGLGGIARGFRRAGQFVDPGLKRRDARVLSGDARLGGRQLKSATISASFSAWLRVVRSGAAVTQRVESSLP